MNLTSYEFVPDAGWPESKLESMVISPNVTVHFPRMRPLEVSFLEEFSGQAPPTAAIQTLPPPALTLPWKRLVGKYARDDTDQLRPSSSSSSSLNIGIQSLDYIIHTYG